MPRPKSNLTEEEKREKRRQYKKEWSEKNKDKIAQYGKIYRENNPDKIIQQRKNIQDKIEQQRKEYRETNEFKIEQQIKKSTKIIQAKISNSKEADIKKNREFDIDYGYITDLLQKQNNTCNRCKMKIKTEWDDAFDKEQFSINRLDNSIGHIKSNIEITCLNCNYKLGEDERFKRGCIRKQSYKTKKNGDKINYMWVFSYRLRRSQIKHSKSFSINKYGEKKAYQMCIDFQNEIFPLTS